MRKNRSSVQWGGVLLALSLALLVFGCEDLIYETPEFNNPYDPINEESEESEEREESEEGGEDEENGTTFDYAIGDVGQAGGLVFYIDEANEHSWTYLEVWIADEGLHSWKTAMTGSPGTFTAIGSGYVNTYDGMIGTEHPAADIVRNAAHGGYSDWFLPSRDELNLMYVSLHLEGTGGFAPVIYWSSSENIADTAWGQDFGTGQNFSDDKIDESTVRAVRAF